MKVWSFVTILVFVLGVAVSIFAILPPLIRYGLVTLGEDVDTFLVSAYSNAEKTARSIAYGITDFIRVNTFLRLAGGNEMLADILIVCFAVFVAGIFSFFVLTGVTPIPWGFGGYSGRSGKSPSYGSDESLTGVPMHESERKAYNEGYSDYREYFTDKPPEQRILHYSFRYEQDAYRKGWEDSKKGNPRTAEW